MAKTGNPIGKLVDTISDVLSGAIGALAPRPDPIPIPVRDDPLRR